MLNRAPSQISLDTIEPESEPYHDSWDEDAASSPIHSQEVLGARLCMRCQNFDIQSFTRNPGLRKGYLLKDVEAAARNGCGFCCLLFDAVKDVEKPEYTVQNRFIGSTTTNPDLYVHMTMSHNYVEESSTDLQNGLRANRLLVELGDRFSEMRNKSDVEICLAADTFSPAALSGDITGRYVGNHPLSESHYTAARNWIQACSSPASSHTKCKGTVSGSLDIDPYDSPLPTRVVEIVRENGLQKLYLRNTEGMRGAYITLTHRWNAGTERCRTVMENYEERLLAGDLGELPQLFKDALLIAEKLDIRYMWIDSICIIQSGDDAADWRREAPKMAQYYQFSIFTLAGTAEDMSNGILQPYSEGIVPWEGALIRLPYKDKTGGNAGNFYVYKRRIAAVDEYMAQVRSSILFRRGWILQEWLLSKRLLWYTPNGLFFECQQEPPKAYDDSQLSFNRANPALRAHLQLKASFHYSNSNILDFWYHGLEVYSGQHLTKPEMDRILAVSGLAKEVAPILMNGGRAAAIEAEDMKEVYIAGLWLRDLHHGLLWEEDHAAGPSNGQIEKAPSWSWASLMTLMKWPERGKGTKPALKITGICMQRQKKHSTPDYKVIGNLRMEPTNQEVEQARFDPENMFACLHVRGKVHTVHVRGYLDSKENLQSVAFSTVYSPVPTSCKWRAICSAFKPETIAGWGSLERMKQDEGTCADFGRAVYALHVSTRYLRLGAWLKTADPVLDVLFIEAVDEQARVFRRIGVGRISAKHLIREFQDSEECNIQLV